MGSICAPQFTQDKFEAALFQLLRVRVQDGNDLVLIIKDAGFAQQMRDNYEVDLTKSTPR